MSDHGFTWGNMEVTRMMTLPNGGHVLNVKAEGKKYQEGVEIYLSPKGRSIRVWRNGKELT
jgi:hypothetical protein